jgi:hypothetical protein
MAKRFNKDMDKYLRTRKEEKLTFRFGSKDGEPGFLSSLFKKEKEEQIPAEDLTEEERERLEAMEEEIEAAEMMEEEDPEHAEIYEEARESMIERFFQSLRLFRRKHQLEDEEEHLLEAEEEFEEEKQRIEEDVREVLKITHTWLEKLTPKQKTAFKNSKDYERYTEILVKHKLARKK